jgi:hypothetical protein
MGVDVMPAGSEHPRGTLVLETLNRARAATLDFGRMTMTLQ